MRVGADYYPEHWPRERWETDARLMQAAGFNVVRMAEFAWVNLEPEEGRFEFGWLDDAIELLGRHGIATILGTPTAVMPAWVARKYPECLLTQPNGTPLTWGMRKNNCFTSGAFRLLSERITRAMAAQYARHPQVIGWQTDNEFGGHLLCYCASCRNDFQDWLRRRYHTLDGLNQAWGTHFWGQTYQTWGEIPLPDDFSAHNPSACLDFKRHFSDLNVRFQRDQVRILRAANPAQFITHNFMGLFSEINYYDLAEDLDFVSWDNYPIGGQPEIPYGASMAADVMRGLKNKNFWIMEQTVGAHGWGTFGRLPRPGEIRKISYQQLAHGGDGQIWFRWRACTAGREQYWHGILGHDGIPQRRYQEAAQVAREYQALAPRLTDTTVRADVAFLYDYESVWALSIQPAYKENKYHEVLLRYYSALFRAGVNVDMVRPGGDLASYKVVFAPDLYLLPDALARQLSDFVHHGGVLVTDCRSAVKDATSLCHARTLPGLLSEALGIRIEEYEALQGGMEYPVRGLATFPGSFTAIHFADWVVPVAAERLAAFDEWHVRDFAALTTHACGAGRGYYVGAIFKEPAFYDQLVARVLQDAGIAPVIAPPPGVEASCRTADGRRCLFLINHTESKQTVTVPAGRLELISGAKTAGTLDLPPYGIAVLDLA